MIRRLAALLAFLAVAATTAFAQTPPRTPPGAGPTAAPALTPGPIPTALPTIAPTPAAVATAPAAAPARKPPANLIEYTGQLLDVRDGYVYFTSGDAFRTVPILRIVDYTTGLPTTIPPRAKMFARATFDPATKEVLELAITTHRLPISQSVAVQPFAVEKSAFKAAAELAGQKKLTGKMVAVVFEVTAPPTTGLTDTLYISTDISDWNPQAIKLDRVNGYEYRALRYFASGTKFAYLVTRGSWSSVERGQSGLDEPPHKFSVPEVDALTVRVVVYHWSDENPANQGVGPQAIPTPYNSNPFGGGPGGIAVPQLPTPFPTRQP